MEIQYRGLTGFKIKTKKTDIIIDPLSRDTGAKEGREKADIVLLSRPHSPYFVSENVLGAYLIDCAGEYEVKGVMVFAYPVFDGKEVNVVYEIIADDVSVVHLGGLVAKPKNGILDEMGTVDVLLIPVGGMFSLDAKTAKDVINSINPIYVIPCNYQIDGLVSPLKEGLEKIDKFLGLMDVKKLEPQIRFKVEKRQIKNREDGSMEVVMLTAIGF